MKKKSRFRISLHVSPEIHDALDAIRWNQRFPSIQAVVISLISDHLKGRHEKEHPEGAPDCPAEADSR